MQDFFKRYHQKKILSHLGVFSISAVLAVSINMFVLGGDTGQHLKANVLELTSSTEVSDLEIVNNNGVLAITNNQEMNQVLEISISLAYNPELVTFSEINSDLQGNNVTIIENESGFSTYIINLDSAIDIPSNTNILHLAQSKNSPHTAHLNPININFTDLSGETFLLNSKPIMF